MAVQQVKFLPLEPEDLKSISLFQPEDWPDILPAHNFYLNSWFCRAMKVEQNNEIVAIGTAIVYQDSAWLGHIIVRSEFRNQGWGNYITNQLVEMLNGKVRSISLIASDLGYPIYQKIGFRSVVLYEFYKTTKSADWAASYSIIPYSTRYHCAILELDKSISGEIRSRLLQDHLPSCKICVEDNRVVACYFPSLGEGLIISRSPNSGIAMIEAHLRDKSNIVLPERNTAAREFLLANNFFCFKKSHRMVIGKQIDFAPENLYNRAGGNIG